ncbi:MAG: lipopolysaccharide core heptose(I) kinase RfaP, partial [Pseudomonadota bacterium]|nr:lipopolysaccharide core heptose(I) kinase RfaP [Pseudomonadota bacterium]
RRQGHETNVYVSEWEGERPDGVEINVLPSQRFTNHAQNADFYRQFRAAANAEYFDAVIGFNKMPGLDIYYGADYCYIGRAVPRYGPLYRLTPRYHRLYTFERSVFDVRSDTTILSLSKREKGVYQQFYGTPENRFHLLPPTLDAERRIDADTTLLRMRKREELGLTEDQLLLLFIGSGFKTKGLDRAITALQALPAELKANTELYVLGQDSATPFQRLAQRLGVSPKVTFLGGRADVQEFLVAGDLLIHPAYSENTGTVLLEAIAAGLPVLATDVCGYADHINRAEAGVVLRSPFRQQALDDRLAEMLVSPQRPAWQRNGREYGRNPDLFKMPQTAVQVIEEWVVQQRRTRDEPKIREDEGACIYLRRDLERSFPVKPGFDDMMAMSGEVFREAPGRRTVRLERGGKRYFLKTHTGVGWQEIMKNLIYFRLPVLGAMNEWHGIHHIDRLGISTLTAAGYGTTRGNPAKRRSFILTDDLSGTVSLEEFCGAWRHHPPRRLDEVHYKRWLIRRLAEIARDIHNSGANHRDFYLCHFLLKPGYRDGELDPKSSRIHVIDLHRMQIRRRTPTRWAVKDISGLYFSSMDVGLTDRDRFRFMKIYRSCSLRHALSHDTLFWRRVRSRGRNLYEAENRRARAQAAAAKKVQTA